MTNIARAVVARVDGPATEVDLAGLRLRALSRTEYFAPGAQVDVAIRAERVNLRRLDPETHPENTLEAEIVEEFAYGSTHTLHMDPTGPGPHLEVEIASRPYEVLDVAHRRHWLVELPAPDLHLMPASDRE